MSTRKPFIAKAARRRRPPPLLCRLGVHFEDRDVERANGDRWCARCRGWFDEHGHRRLIGTGYIRVRDMPW
jgi:hypothetical protein